ncbi:sulfatase [Lewinella sp. IMCC34191]|uniref:sulfatase family protein n=1 Tax=Lewinella sp. IMCC34191 TaxID=2259172 RepID=UPI000E26A5CD|nr:sulfatase [Lewinella sp. IMCC34191]
MLRSATLYLFILILTACGTASDSETDADQAARRPNIIFIMSDDHAQRAISAYSDELIQTPNLDRIANEGMLFHNSFVTNSICAPSRAAILTGKYSHINGKIDNLSPFDPNQWTFTEALHDAGYRTSLFGKHHLQEIPHGLDEYRALIGQGDYYNPTFIHNGDTLAPTKGYTTTLITDYALEELQRNADSDQPFMMLYWHKAPHRNWMPDTSDLDGLLDNEYPEPATLRDDYAGRPAAANADMRIADMFVSQDLKVIEEYEPNDPGTGGATFWEGGSAQMARYFYNEIDRLHPDQRAAWQPFLDRVGREWQQVKGTEEELSWRYQRYMQDYLASVKSVDDNVGRVLDYLDESGLADNTIVIYTSDQGFYLGEHGWYDKRFMYEESHRTPLMIRYPARIDAGTTVDELVLNIDIAPTLLELADTLIPEELQGYSLVPLFDGEAPDDWRDFIYYRYYQQMNSFHRVARHEGVRGDRYKLIHFTEPGFEGYELYDLDEDPNEMENRIDDPDLTAEKERLQSELREKRRELEVTD